MRASNLQEYVGKYAGTYARARDEELQELLKFKKASSCSECDKTFPSLDEQTWNVMGVTNGIAQHCIQDQDYGQLIYTNGNCHCLNNN